MFSTSNGSKKNDKGPVTMAGRILGFCFAIFLSVLLLYLAIDLLAAIWGWLLLAGICVLAIWVGVVLSRRWRDRW